VTSLQFGLTSPPQYAHPNHSIDHTQSLFASSVNSLDFLR